jgi:hypothetical protein
MRQRIVEIDLPTDLSGVLADAITAYAHAAFPDGGSECAQVSREALLETARQVHAHPGGTIGLRKRQMPQLRAAVNWYFAEIDPASAAQGDALKTALSNKRAA